MSGNLIHIVQPEPQSSVVELLEDLLERAKSGEIQAIAGVTETPSREFGEFFSDSALEQCIPFISYLRVLQLRMEREVQF